MIKKNLLVAPMALFTIGLTSAPVMATAVMPALTTVAHAATTKDETTDRTLTINKFENAVTDTTGTTHNGKGVDGTGAGEVGTGKTNIKSDGTETTADGTQEQADDTANRDDVRPMKDVKFTITRVNAPEGGSMKDVIADPSTAVKDTTWAGTGMTETIKDGAFTVKTGADGKVKVNFGTANDGYYLVHEEDSEGVESGVKDFIVALPMTTKGAEGADDSINYNVNVEPKNTTKDVEAPRVLVGADLTDNSLAHNTHKIANDKGDEVATLPNSFLNEGIFAGQAPYITATDKVPAGLVNTDGTADSTYEINVSADKGITGIDWAPKEGSTVTVKAFDKDGTEIDASKNDMTTETKATAQDEIASIKGLNAKVKEVKTDGSFTLAFDDASKVALDAHKGEVVAYNVQLNPTVSADSAKQGTAGMWQGISTFKVDTHFVSANGLEFKHEGNTATLNMGGVNVKAVNKLDENGKATDANGREGDTFAIAATEDDAKAGNFLHQDSNGKILAPGDEGYADAPVYQRTTDENGDAYFGGLYLDDGDNTQSYWAVMTKAGDGSDVDGGVHEVSPTPDPTDPTTPGNPDNPEPIVTGDHATPTLTPTGMMGVIIAGIVALMAVVGISVESRKNKRNA